MTYPLPKPPHGTPCNNCGLCCENDLCPLGQIAFPRAQAPCPALEADGDRRLCGLIAHPERYAPLRARKHGIEAMRSAATWATGSGIGCDARLEDERDVPTPTNYVRALKAAAESSTRPKRRYVERLWGGAR